MAITFVNLDKCPIITQGEPEQYGILYLASPYSNGSEDVRERRYRMACRATAELIRLGWNVYSPIVHGHHLVRHGLPTDFWFWQEHDFAMIERCHSLVVLPIDGWRESIGVVAELRFAEKRGIPRMAVQPALAAKWERAEFPERFQDRTTH